MKHFGCRGTQRNTENSSKASQTSRISTSEIPQREAPKVEANHKRAPKMGRWCFNWNSGKNFDEFACTNASIPSSSPLTPDVYAPVFDILVCLKHNTGCWVEIPLTGWCRVKSDGNANVMYGAAASSCYCIFSCAFIRLNETSSLVCLCVHATESRINFIH